MFTAGDETYVVGQKPGTALYDGALWKMRPDGNLLEVPATGLGGELAQVIIAGTKSSKGWFLVGTIGAAEGNNDGAVWTSTDGRAWQQLPDEIFGGAGDQVATSVCTLADGRAVVGGYAPATETGPTVPVAWFQDEQGGWNGTLLSASSGYVADCASTSSGVVLAGVQGNKAGVWKTVDGPTYTPFELPDQGPGFVSITSVAAGPNGTVLAGQVDDGSGTRDVAVWVASTSPTDKIRRLSLPAAFKGWGEQFVDHILLEGNRAVMVGSSEAAPRVWESPNVFRK
jgi:hypothetical protein